MLWTLTLQTVQVTASMWSPACLLCNIMQLENILGAVWTSVERQCVHCAIRLQCMHSFSVKQSLYSDKCSSRKHIPICWNLSLKMHQNAPFGVLFSKIFRGCMPPDPPRGCTALPCSGSGPLGRSQCRLARVKKVHNFQMWTPPNFLLATGLDGYI